MGPVDVTSLSNIRKVLVANRGEIAVRCIKACRELGVRSVAIITNADATSLHAALADEVVLLPGEDSTAYTNGEAILDICKRTNADAIIPGYGFLSENVEFAESVSSAGIIFVGPSSASINTMGLKHEARAIAQAANVPVIPGTQLLDSADAAVAAAKSLGCPVMLKATGGGGGMGLQICHSEQDVEKAFAMVESRATTLFKNSRVFLEKYYPNSRHIEVQVAGNGEIVVAFGEPDFFFLEMNTRLQVEHGITELCYGVDLVHLMLRQADYELGGHIGIPSEVLKSLGRPKPLGSAIEARLYAEVPLRDFAPSPGVLQHVYWPEGEGVRVDTWVRSGQRITSLYDPLIGKVMAYSPDGRVAAQKKMLAILANTALQGTQSNLEYCSRILESEMFASGNTLTNSLSTFKFDSCSLQVIDPGVFTTIQDYPGRIAVGHGIPPGGPMDDVSARMANILVGNDTGVELLEATLSGPKLLFHEAAVVAVCGAELPVTLDGAPQPMWSRIVIRKSQILELGKVAGNGLRTYLAVRGGFPQVPKFLGSKSTAPELGFGGVQGRKLLIHDILTLSPQSRGWATEATPLSLPPNVIPDFTENVTICCIDGPYASEDILTPEGHEILYEANWTWARASGGGGGSHPSNVLDYGYPNGGVNFTGEFPIIFGPDRPDLGGFVCPTTVCSGEMWKLGQVKPGNTIRFRSVTYDSALDISRRKDDFFQALAVFSQGNADQISPLVIELTDETSSSVLHQKQPQGNHPRVTYRQGGDTSIIVEYGNQVADLRNTACVQFLTKQMSNANLPSVRSDPNFASVTVRFDPFQLDRSKLLQQLIQFDGQIGQTTGIKIPVREVRLPVCLDHSSLQESAQRYMENIRPSAAYMPDNVEYIRKNNALETRQQVFDALLKTPWLAVAVGFYVGTPILFPLDPWHSLTGQKYNPSRVYTPSGSVGLGGSLVAIYPVAAPGGYQLMGRTLGGWDGAGNRPGFSAERPWLFNHLDLVKFYEVSEEEYDKIERDFETGRYEFDIAQTTLDMDKYIAKFEAAANDPAYQAWKQRQAEAAQEVGELEQRLFEEWTAAKSAGKDAAAAEGDDAGSANAVSIESPINANVCKVLVKPGDVLEKGQTVAVLEAMKMEINLIVDDVQAGAVVTKIRQPPGSMVSPGTPVVDGRRQD
nr:urea amidolyase_carboxylase protein [Trichoderma polysporum]